MRQNWNYRCNRSKHILKKVDEFLAINHFQKRNKDPAEKYQKQIQQKLEQCSKVID